MYVYECRIITNIIVLPLIYVFRILQAERRKSYGIFAPIAAPIEAIQSAAHKVYVLPAELIEGTKHSVSTRLFDIYSTVNYINFYIILSGIID